MKRILYVWMPYLPTERLMRRKHSSHDPTLPLALVEKVGNARQITALNPAAHQMGLRALMPVADAQNVHPTLQTLDHNKEADAQFLRRLGLWAMRFTPLVMEQGSDGLALNITGCAHLFGGEQAMLKQCQARFAAQGLTTHIAIADTIGAAHAIARYSQKPTNIITPGYDAHMKALAPLTLWALTSDQNTFTALKSVGLKTIGDLQRASRAALARRYKKTLVTAYDQALGRSPEAFHPLLPSTPYREARNCIDPLISFADLCEATSRLAPDLATQLDKAGLGATRLRLMLFRLDGHVVWFDVRIGTASHDAAHFIRLLHDRLRQLEPQIDAGFGFERALLEASETAGFAHTQTDSEPIASSTKTINTPALTALADTLRARFGDHTVQRFYPRASHWPERSCKLGSDEGTDQDWSHHCKARPLMLFDPPQAIEATAEVPDAPPKRFLWRHQTFVITYAEGAERMAPEWWLVPEAIRKMGPDVIRRFKSRDYYRLEDQAGHRFWVFRRGLYEPDLAPTDEHAPRWFIHGQYA